MGCFVFFLHLATMSMVTNSLLAHSASDDKNKHNGPVVNVTKHLTFSNFTALSDVKLLGSAKLSSKSSAVQIPDDSLVDDLRDLAGRALFSSPIRLLDPHTKTPASFFTTFSFHFHNATSSSVTRVQSSLGQSGGYGYGGSGLAFVIVPDEFTVGRPGAWLGMMNDACEDDYKVIAIEFDTRMNKEFGDPNDNHVGINLGTVISTDTANASDVGVDLNDGTVHRAWISYDGTKRWMEISLGPDNGSYSYSSKPIYSGSLDLSPFLNEYMFVGFSASTGNHTQVHSIMSWNFTSISQAFLRVPSMETCESKIVVDSVTRKEPQGLFLIFMAVLALSVAVMLSLYYNSRRRRASLETSSNVVLPDKKMRPRPPHKPRSFTLSEISMATRSFGELEMLGGGLRGVCYRGKLSNGCQVVVKRFSQEFLSSQGLDRRRLLKEIKGISKIRHPNLVPIRGWCQDKNETMVVYEFFPNGGLDKWLFGVGVLPWTRRFKVVKDVAEALSFLHSKQLAHKNLKTTSVFLDVSFRAVLGDFGFVLCGAESRRFEAVVSQSADVFEFGLFVLEVVCGRKRVEAELGEVEERDLLEFTWRMHEIGEMRRVVDKRMGAVINLEQAIRVAEIGLLCTMNVSKGRPSMEQVVEFLCMETPIPELPQTRPVALFPYNSTSALCTGYSCAPFK